VSHTWHNLHLSRVSAPPSKLLHRWRARGSFHSWFCFVKCAVSSPIDNPMTGVFYWITIRRHIVLLLALTCGGGAVYAPLANTTSLVGTVTDAAGAAMPDVSITAVNIATQDTYKVSTNSD